MKKKYSALILITALLISIILNLFFFNKAIYYYRQLNRVLLDPLGLTYYSAATDYSSGINSHPEKIVFFGDSRSRGWQSPAGTDQFRFINRGIAGQTSSQVIKRFDYHIKPLQPDFIVVQVGINDLKAIPLFPGRKETIITNCKENIARIISKSLDIGSTVIMTTIFPLSKVPVEHRFFWSSDVAEAIDEVNDYIYTLKGPNVFIIDTAAILANEKGIIRKDYRRDFLHINAAGYSALNNELLRVLIESSG